MKPLIKNLVKTLNDIINYYTCLHSLLVKEKEIMIKRSIKDLEECTKQKETVALKLKMLDDSRMLLLAKISSNLHIDQKKLTLTALGDMLGDEYNVHFYHISKKLNRLIREIAIQNNENKACLELYMNHMKVTLSYISQINFNQNTYLQTGEFKQISSPGRILCKA